jgi:predicted RNase H-like nuclease (RuvC/YqgF family)
MTVKEYAKQNQVSIETVRRRIRSGKLEAELVEGQYIIDNNKVATPPQQDNNTSTIPPQQDNNNQNGLEVERLKAEIKNLKSKIDDQERIIKAKDKCIEVQDNALGFQTAENDELKFTVQQLGDKLAYARRPVWRKFVDLLSFR